MNERNEKCEVFGCAAEAELHPLVRGRVRAFCGKHGGPVVSYETRVQIPIDSARERTRASALGRPTAEEMGATRRDPSAPVAATVTIDVHRDGSRRIRGT